MADRRTARTVLALLGGVLLLAGCASMPDSGGVHKVPLSEKREDQQVRIYAEPPEKDASPEHIVSGFLEALMSDDYATVAQAYLTKDAKDWTPGETTVLAEAPDVALQRAGGPNVPDQEESQVEVELVGDQIARVDGTGTYTPDEREYAASMSVVQDPDSEQWRIENPPSDLVIGRADFERIYESANTYYFTERSRDALVADPVFVRQQIDPVTDAVSTLIDGPGTWLSPVAQTTFPPGTRLAHGVHLAIDKDGTLRVPLSLPSRPGTHACERMAAQVLHTVQSQEGLRVGRVELLSGKDPEATLCDLAAGEGGRYAPGQLAHRPAYQYFVDSKHRLVRLPADDDSGVVAPGTVFGPFGDTEPGVGSAAVSRSEDQAAAVTEGGGSLYVSPLKRPSELGEAVLTSGGGNEGGDGEDDGGGGGGGEGDGLTAPSWDGLGDLWVADRVGDESRLYWLRGGDGEPERIDVPGLGGGRIESLRMSADGSRIALVVSEGDDRRLMLGVLSVEDDRPVLVDLRESAPQLEDVRAVAWAGESRLVVVGKEAEGVQQMRLVSTDGSVPPTVELAQGLTGVTAVAASEDASKPLVAASEDGIVRLPPNAYWEAVPGGKGGTAPIYPG